MCGASARAVQHTRDRRVETLLQYRTDHLPIIWSWACLERGGSDCQCEFFESESRSWCSNAQGISKLRREAEEISGFSELSGRILTSVMQFQLARVYANLGRPVRSGRRGAVDEDLSADNISPDDLTLFSCGIATPKLSSAPASPP